MNTRKTILSIAIAAVSLITTQSFAQTDTNKVDAQGKKQGLWVENLGPTKWIGNYIDGKKQGVWISHHYNGIMDELTVYKDDKRNGMDVNVDVNGYFKSEKTYKNDTIDGLATEYSPGGKISSQIMYKVGIYNGVR